MNILMLSWRGPGHPLSGGAEIVMHEHAKAWVKAGHSVTLFTSFFQGAKKKQIVDGVEVIRRGGQVFDVQLRAFLWYFFGKHEKYDLVVDEFHGLPFFTPLYNIFPRGEKVKKVAFIHETASEVLRYNPWPKPAWFIPAILGPFFEPFIFKLYRKLPFITVSESTKKDLIKVGISSKSIEVIENGFIYTDPGKVKKEIAPTLIYLGALGEDKGIYDAVEIFNLIKQKDDMWQFWIIGKGSEEILYKLKKLLKKRDLSNKVKLWGFVNERKKFQLLKKAHIMINPSYHEGWGLINLEANSVGIPVVGYDVHGTRDSIKNGKTGLIVMKGDFKEAASAVIDLYKNRGSYQKMQDECRLWAKNFDWKKSIKKSLTFIESL